MNQDRLNILILGGGGREHAMALAAAQSPRAGRIVCAPGNAGTLALGENVAVDVMDFDALTALARERAIDLTLVGPEAPLCGGIVDHFRKAGLRIFGPTASAAKIEGDKAYAKSLMRSADIPTAEARVFTRFEDARAYALTRDEPLVVKAAGLAAGKGVVVCDTPAQAVLAAEKIMVDRRFGSAGRTVLIEERLKGEELSVLALVSGRAICILESAQDHKTLGDGDTGPNTGGMGAYSPAPSASTEVLRGVERDILLPIVDCLDREGHPYQGVLYVGLMLTVAEPKVLEFNCRFGDPEAQVIIPRMCGDFLSVVEAVVEGRLEDASLEWDPRPAVGVVMASRGYPGTVEDGKVITGLEEAAALPDVTVYHSGTRWLEHHVLTRGGRVLTVTARGDTHADAQQRAYEAVARIHFDGAHYRRDIAYRAIHQDAAASRGA